MAHVSSSSSAVAAHAKTSENALTASAPPTTGASASYARQGSWQAPTHWSQMASTATHLKKMNKQRQRTDEENQQSERIAARVAERIMADQAAATNPDVDTPFVDAQDVVKRLLPYHVFQQPREDLRYITRVQGKRKDGTDDLREEIRETKIALECFHRRAKLEKRFRKIRTKGGHRTAPDDQGVYLAQAVLDGDRAEAAVLNAELRSLRNEFDRIEREKRLAAAVIAAAQRPYYQATPTASTSTAATTMTTTPTTTYNRSYYHNYTPYNYSTTYGTTTAAQSGVSSFSVPLLGASTLRSGTTTPAAATTTAPVPSTSTVPASVPTSATPITSTFGTASSPTGPVISSGPVPVQLPVSALPALQSMGIMPVMAPAQGSEPAAAVLRSTDGTMLNLDINVALLKPHQMQGLSLILNSLMTRTAQKQSTSQMNGDSVA